MFLQNKKTKYKGFSLMEMVIAIFVFSLIMTTVTTIFVNVASARKKAKAIQKDVEEARFAMEQIAKTLRTSTIFTADGQGLTILAYDHSQNMCVQYSLDSANKKIRYGSLGTAQKNDPVNAEKVTDCGNSVLKDLSGANVSDLKFAITKSSDTTVGKVTIMIRICYKGTCGINVDEARIQTTVSLRDYWESN